MEANATVSGGSAEQAADDALGSRELEASHEIARAFLSATQPIEVYRLALARLTSTVRADFAAVFLRDEVDTDLLRPVCLHGWPQASARFIGQMRIRVGNGPTGRAVAENVAVEVEDIFGDDTLADWWDAARELGFASMITLPLTTETGVSGAVSFYFAESRTYSDEERRLLKLISEHLAATTMRSHTFQQLRSENDRLRREVERGATAMKHAEARSRTFDRLLAGISRDLRLTLSSLQSELAGGAAMRRTSADVLADDAARTIDDLTELLELRLGRARIGNAPEDAGRLGQSAAAAAGPPPPGVEFSVQTGGTIIPIATDGPRAVRAIATLLGDAFRRVSRGTIELTVTGAQDETGQWVDWTVKSRGMGVDGGGPSADRAERRQSSLDFALAEATALALGGELSTSTERGDGSTGRLRLPRRRPDR